jgi:hypothetical protein
VTVEWRDRRGEFHYSVYINVTTHGINGGVSHYGIITNYIGYNSSTATYTSVLCDNFRVYTYPLTSSEITAVYELRSTTKDS